MPFWAAPNAGYDSWSCRAAQVSNLAACHLTSSSLISVFGVELLQVMRKARGNPSLPDQRVH
jgi:hypothetical protein